jgi:hypothetical protein
MELKARDLTVSIVTAVDLASLASACRGCGATVKTKRANEALWPCLDAAAAPGDHGSAWTLERHDWERRWKDTVRAGGKRVWAPSFADIFSPLRSNGDHITVSGESVSVGGGLEFAFAPRRKGRLVAVEYRLTRDGVIVGLFDVELEGNYAVPEVIKLLDQLEAAARNTTMEFIVGLLSGAFGHKLYSMVGSHDHVRPLVHISAAPDTCLTHSLVVIREFVHVDTLAAAPLSLVGRSPELAGIVNRAPWYRAFGVRLAKRLREKEFGYREDEIYIVDRNTTVVVNARFYAADTLVYYRRELELAVIHCLSRLAIVSELLRSIRIDLRVYPHAITEPALVLASALEARSTLVQLMESVEIGPLIRQGFLRLFVGRLTTELGLRGMVSTANGWLDLAERTAMPASLRSAELSVLVGARNNRLQAIAIMIAAVALVLSAALQIFDIMATP